jgi:hypothetical protein
LGILPIGYVFTYVDFGISVDNKEAVIKALNRMVASGKIAKLSKGKNGKPTGVFIPINDWEIMKKEHKNLEVWEEAEPTKAEILAGIKDAVEEVKLIKAGKIKPKSLKELLNEL